MLYRKALVRLNKKVSLVNVNDYFTPFLIFGQRILIFRWVGFETRFKMSGAILWLLPILINGMATFGWCSTEKPALFTRPSHVLDRGLEFRFCSLLLLGGHHVGYSKCKSAFSISSATISFLPSYQHAFKFHRNK